MSEKGKPYWDQDKSEDENFKLGSSYPPIRVYLSAVDLARINSLDPVVVSVILSDGKELDLELMLETDRDVFAKDLRGLLDASENSP